MKVERRKMKYESCNFCDKAKLAPDHNGLVYPYDHVTILEGKAIVVCLCDECLNQLKSLTEVNHG